MAEEAGIVLDGRQFQPFCKLDETLWRRVGSLAERRTLRTGKALWYQGESARFACLILSGSIRTVMYRSDDTSLDMGVFGPGDWLGIAELVVSGPSMCDAVPTEPCGILAFGRNAFDALLAMGGIKDWFLADLARRQYALYSRVELARPQDRLAAWLSASGKKRVVCTQEGIAEAIGLTRETVNRTLSRMQENGVLRVGRGWVEIIDPDSLI